MQNLLYIHGFNSSPKSLKAELTREYFEKNYPNIKFHCPQLASSPIGAITQLEKIIEQTPEQSWMFIGSSLGGFFSTYLAEKYAASTVLINPAVRPYNVLDAVLGVQKNPYTGEVYQVLPEHMEDLKTLEPKIITKNNYLVMVQTGDEVLNYQHAVEKYHECEMVVQDGGDHSFVNFENMLPKIALFFNL